MVMLASYECSQHCAGVVTCLSLLWRHFTLDVESFSCEDPDPGLLQTSGFSTVFANSHYKYTSAVSSASVGLATI